MKRPKISILTMLLLLTILTMAVFVITQNYEMGRMRETNKKLAVELGVIGKTASDKIAVRELLSKGEFNTWRFRVSKPTNNHEFCFGIVDVDSTGIAMLPEKYRAYYQVVKSASEGETEVVFSVWRDENSKWWMKFQEFEGDEKKIATATRIDIFPENAVRSVVQMKEATIQNRISIRTNVEQEHGELRTFRDDETVWLIHSENQSQTQDPRQAFVLAMRPIQSKPEAE